MGWVRGSRSSPHRDRYEAPSQFPSFFPRPNTDHENFYVSHHRILILPSNSISIQPSQPGCNLFLQNATRWPSGRALSSQEPFQTPPASCDRPAYHSRALPFSCIVGDASNGMYRTTFNVLREGLLSSRAAGTATKPSKPHRRPRVPMRRVEPGRCKRP